MYGKIFETIYDGTLVEHWEALVTFEQMIVLCDADGILDMTPDALSRRTGIPKKIILAGIKILEQPDEKSRTPDEDGCRIVRLDEHRDWGWRLVNHKKYKDLNGYEKVREQNRLRQQKHREKSNVTSRDNNAKSRHTDTYTDTNINKKITLRVFLSQAKEKGEKAIPPEHAVFKYAERMQIPAEMIHVAWYSFKHRYIDTEKKYKDWRITFLNAVKGNWCSVWYVDENGGFCWSSKGLQAKKSMELNAEDDL